MQPQVAVEMRGLPAHARIAVDPCFDSHAQWSKLPLLPETDPRAHRELLRVEREVGISIEELKQPRSQPSFAWIFQTDVQTPRVWIVEIEETFSRAANVDQFSGVVETAAGRSSCEYRRDRRCR